MMLELNSKPKKLIVQRHSKSNNWLTEAVMVKSEEETDHRRWTVDEVYYLLETFEIPCDESYGDLAQAPCRAVCRPCGFFRMMHGGGSAPSCCAFTHRVAFEEVSGHQVLIKSGPENCCHSAKSLLTMNSS